MYPNNKQRDLGIDQRRQQGSALVIAIFIIIVMTLLGTALVRMLSTEAESVAYEVIGTRAFQAAQSGIQWQLQKVFPLNGPAIECPPAKVIKDFTNSGADGRGLKNCKAELICSYIDKDNIRYYQIESVGRCEVGEVETSRKIVTSARSL